MVEVGTVMYIFRWSRNLGSLDRVKVPRYTYTTRMGIGMCTILPRVHQLLDLGF